MGGLVTHAGWSYWLGWDVLVQNNGSQMIFGHVCCGESGMTTAPTGESTFRVQERDVIEAGSVVGKTGETGNSVGIQLNFDVRRCDGAVRCSIQNPSNIMLPGQNPLCDWEGSDQVLHPDGEKVFPGRIGLIVAGDRVARPSPPKCFLTTAPLSKLFGGRLVCL